MTSSVSPLVPDAVALHEAMLCVNCDMITETRSQCCLVCGSPSLLSLARVLGMISGEPARRLEALSVSPAA